MGVAAISYDSGEVLRSFSTRMGGIHFPLLSDSGSAIIRAFGIFNDNIPKDDEVYGICFPGTYIVDENGVVRAKYFEGQYRQRYTPNNILVHEFDAEGGKRIEVKTDHLTVEAYPSEDTASRGNRITMVVVLRLPPKMHVYAPGVEGYRPVSLEVEANPMLLAHDTEFPQAKTVHLDAIGETVPVYEGEVRILKDVTISPRLRAETVRISMTLSYQACDDKVCYIPAKVPLSVELELAPHDETRVPEELQRKSPPKR